MTLHEKLQSHKGGLLRIKSELYWYGGRGWDGIPERLCLVLDAAITAPKPAKVVARVSQPDSSSAVSRFTAVDQRAVAHLLIDGEAHWVGVFEKYVELIDDPA